MQQYSREINESRQCSTRLTPDESDARNPCTESAARNQKLRVQKQIRFDFDLKNFGHLGYVVILSHTHPRHLSYHSHLRVLVTDSSDRH